MLDSERDVNVSTWVRSPLRGETEKIPEILVLVWCSIVRWEEDFVERGNEYWRWLKRKVCSL